VGVTSGTASIRDSVFVPSVTNGTPIANFVIHIRLMCSFQLC